MITSYQCESCGKVHSKKGNITFCWKCEKDICGNRRSEDVFITENGCAVYDPDLGAVVCKDCMSK